MFQYSITIPENPKLIQDDKMTRQKYFMLPLKENTLNNIKHSISIKIL